MKKKGGIDDFKLYYEDIPATKGKIPSSHKKRPETPYIVVLVANMGRGLVNIIHYFIRQCEAFYRFAILNIDDRKNMPRVPQAKKAKRKGKA